MYHKLKDLRWVLIVPRVQADLWFHQHPVGQGETHRQESHGCWADWDRPYPSSYLPVTCRDSRGTHPGSTEASGASGSQLSGGSSLTLLSCGSWGPLGSRVTLEENTEVNNHRG